jgi:hypothetical protein
VTRSRCIRLDGSRACFCPSPVAALPKPAGACHFRAPRIAIVTDKGLCDEEPDAFFTGPDLGLTLIRPARKDEKTPRYSANWLRQRVKVIIWTLKNQLGRER